MADLGKYLGDWQRFLGQEIGCLHLAPLRLLREIEDRFGEERTQAQIYVDVAADYCTAATFTGVIVANNVDPTYGLLYVRITGTGPYTVSVHTQPGGSGATLIMQGSGAALATVTLAEQSDSGASGTWTLPASPVATTDDKLRVMPVVDFRESARLILDGSEDKDEETYNDLLAAYATVKAAIGTAKAAIKAALETYVTSVSRRGRAFTGRASAVGYSDVPNPDDGGSGAVSRTRTGFWPDLAQHMEDNTPAEQDIGKATVAAAAATFGTHNDGQGAISAHTPKQNARAMVISGKCVQGGDDGNGGGEKFRLTAQVTGEDEDIAFDSLLTVEQSWSGQEGIGPITLTRTYTKTGDDSDNVFVDEANASISGATNNNTEGVLGTLYWSTVANGSNWDINFYKDSSRTQLVASATNIASGAVFTAAERNASGLSVAWQLGGTESATTGTLVVNFFQTENGAGIPDEFEIAVTISSTSKFAELLAEELGVYLNGETIGSETIGDGYVEMCTFFPMIVEDN